MEARRLLIIRLPQQTASDYQDIAVRHEDPHNSSGSAETTG
jgi:hypothetical protein